MINKLISSILVLLSIASFGKNPVISVHDFATQLKSSPNLIIIDVSAAEVYSKQHIQGAINIPFKELNKPGAVEGQLKTVEELVSILSSKGVSNNSKIVVYDEGMNRYNGRVWWVLKYLGASDVSVLHFNLEQITEAKIGLTAVPNILKAVTFSPTVHPEMICKMAEIQKADRNFLLLDGRDKEEFDGVDPAKRSKGHLPGAFLLSFKDLQTATGAYKSKKEIIEIAAKSGATPDKPIVVYCNTGIKASVLYIALKEIAGFSNVRYYDGSYAEWVSVPENKLVK